MATVSESWARLEKALWLKTPRIASMNDPTAKFQPLTDGSGKTRKDEYKIEIDAMPAGLTPEAYLAEFAKDPDKAVGSSSFKRYNDFTKRTPNRLAIGDIYDIDILGPDNGSIVLVAVSPGFGTTTGDHWFAIQTIECKKYGSHPECGAREFGFFRTGAGKPVFYTRGVSRASTFFHRAGAGIQKSSWTAMMKGIAATIKARGGKANENTLRITGA